MVDKTKYSMIDSYYDYINKFDTNTKGKLFEEFTYNLFTHDPRLNNGLQSIWHYKDIPTTIKSKLKLPNRDMGIDLLAKIDDNYYAIQCKYRTNQSDVISWTELSTFFGLAFGLTDNIKGGFLVTNTYNLCKNAQKSKKITAIDGDYLRTVSKKVLNITNNNKINNEITTKKSPRDYQQICIDASYRHFKLNKNSRAYIEMACGTGKTLTSYWIDLKMCTKRTVIFVPSLYLLSQFYKDWVNESQNQPIPVKYLLIASDIDGKKNGIMLDTNPASIKSFIKKTSDKLVIICTYQSSDKLIEACKNIKLDLALFDEAHKTVGQINKKFTMTLHNKNLDVSYRLFMTATPKVYSNETDDIVSMNNDKYYGDKIFKFNTSDAIRSNVLCDYEILTIHVKNKTINNFIKTNRLIKYEKTIIDVYSTHVATAIILLQQLSSAKCNHIVTYHNTIKSAQSFAKLLKHIANIFKNKQNIYIGSLDGSMTMNQRNKIVREFTDSNHSIICSSQVLNEGVNIPIIDSVCFVDPRSSTIDIVQCVGRCLRLYQGKTKSCVIIPILSDDFDNPTIYTNTINILKSIKTTDNDIVEYFTIIKHGKTYKRNILVNHCVKNITKTNSSMMYSTEIDINKWNRCVSSHHHYIQHFVPESTEKVNTILKKYAEPTKPQVNTLENFTNINNLAPIGNLLPTDTMVDITLHTTFNNFDTFVLASNNNILKFVFATKFGQVIDSLILKLKSDNLSINKVVRNLLNISVKIYDLIMDEYDRYYYNNYRNKILTLLAMTKITDDIIANIDMDLTYIVLNNLSEPSKNIINDWLSILNNINIDTTSTEIFKQTSLLKLFMDWYQLETDNECVLSIEKMLRSRFTNYLTDDLCTTMSSIIKDANFHSAIISRIYERIKLHTVTNINLPNLNVLDNNLTILANNKPHMVRYKYNGTQSRYIFNTDENGWIKTLVEHINTKRIDTANICIVFRYISSVVKMLTDEKYLIDVFTCDNFIDLVVKHDVMYILEPVIGMILLSTESKFNKQIVSANLQSIITKIVEKSIDHSKLSIIKSIPKTANQYMDIRSAITHATLKANTDIVRYFIEMSIGNQS